MKIALHWQILIGLALGLLAGLALNAWHEEIGRVIDPDGDGKGFLAGVASFLVEGNRVAGEMFKRALMFIAVPIIFFAMILAIGSLGDIRQLGRVGGKTCAIFLCTATLSVVIGLTLVNIVKPGSDRFISPEAKQELLASMDPGVAAGLKDKAKSTRPWDLVRDIVPMNVFDSMARGDMLQIVFVALLLGIALALMPGEVAAPVLAVVRGFAEAFTMVVRGIMYTAPVGVFCLIVPIVATLGFDILAALLAYCLTVIVGLALIQFVIYPGVVKVFSPMSLRQFFRGIAQVQMVAFSSSSSAATLPVTIQSVRDRLGVSPDIAGFVCAIGAKINMDGTAMMQAVATVFLAQFYSMDLSLVQQATIVITAVVAAIGTPGIPSGGMVMLVIVLQTYGVNPEGIAMILAVDRVLDMCRTIVNVTGDASVAVAVAATERKLSPVP